MKTKKRLTIDLDESNPLHLACLNLVKNIPSKERESYIITAMLLYSKYPVETHTVTCIENMVKGLVTEVRELRKDVRNIPSSRVFIDKTVGEGQVIDFSIEDDGFSSAFNLNDD